MNHKTIGVGLCALLMSGTALGQDRLLVAYEGSGLLMEVTATVDYKAMTVEYVFKASQDETAPHDASNFTVDLAESLKGDQVIDARYAKATGSSNNTGVVAVFDLTGRLSKEFTEVGRVELDASRHILAAGEAFKGFLKDDEADHWGVEAAIFKAKSSTDIYEGRIVGGYGWTLVPAIDVASPCSNLWRSPMTRGEVQYSKETGLPTGDLESSRLLLETFAGTKALPDFEADTIYAAKQVEVTLYSDSLETAQPRTIMEAHFTKADGPAYEFAMDHAMYCGAQAIKASLELVDFCSEDVTFGLQSCSSLKAAWDVGRVKENRIIIPGDGHGRPKCTGTLCDGEGRL